MWASGMYMYVHEHAKYYLESGVGLPNLSWSHGADYTSLGIPTKRRLEDTSELWVTEWDVSAKIQKE